MRRRLAAAAILALAVGMPARGATPSSGTLSDPGQTVSWTGQSYTTSDAPIPDGFELTVDLPAGYWLDHDGGVEVAIAWESEYNLFDLVVIGTSDVVVASSTGFPSSAQSVIIPKPSNGTYQVVVVPTAIQIDSGYQGIAQVELAPPSPDPPVDRLPDLVPLPPSEFHVARGTYSFMPGEQEGSSCYVDERLGEETPPEECLRFDAGIANLGTGPFELLFDLTTLAGEDRSVSQEIWRSDGTTSTSPAGAYTVHPTHAHVHYQNFATYSLHTVTDQGTPGPLVVASRKSDFCMIDTRLVLFGEPGNQERRHGFPQCDIPALGSLEPTTMRQGISVGWADVYTWDLPGQFIDIGDVPDGTYAVVITANPAGAITESSEENNASFALVELTTNPDGSRSATEL